jgi:hypothetical protein
MSEQTEHHPLLHDEERPSTSILPAQTSHNALVVVGLAFVVLILDLASCITISGPEQAVVEKIICDRYHFATELDPRRCKIEPIQSEVAFILGWKEALQTLPSKMPTTST